MTRSATSLEVRPARARRRWPGSGAALLLVASAAASAGAEVEAEGAATGEEAGGAADARALFEGAVAAAEQGRSAEAIEGFEGSYALSPLPGTLMNLAISLERGGRPVEAHAAWARLLEAHGEAISPGAREQASSRLAELDQSLARIDVSCSPAQASLSLDGQPADWSAEPLWVTPGAHELACEAEGHEPSSSVVDLPPGRTAAVSLHLARAEPSPAVAAVPTEEEEGEGPEELDLALEASTEATLSEPSSFWGGPWPWVIGAALLVAAGATASAALLWPSEGPEADVWIHTR